MSLEHSTGPPKSLTSPSEQSPAPSNLELLGVWLDSYYPNLRPNPLAVGIAVESALGWLKLIDQIAIGHSLGGVNYVIGQVVKPGLGYLRCGEIGAIFFQNMQPQNGVKNPPLK